ncbi:MAG TPA: hypothetical protein VK536_06625 [Candidatus Limnocylindrales bacterium]|nr:hypothetical protein [Candidatus Limnocylindrales bacterium]
MNNNLPETKLKCVTVMVFEEKGKTILQPMIKGQDVPSVNELFQRNILEVWLPNGRPDPSQFDIGIIKYRQMIQPSKMCSRVKSRVCLKNRFKRLASCEQCPIGKQEPQTRNGRGYTQVPNLSPQLWRLNRCST